MDDQKFEELAKRWPDLMQKSQQDYLGVGEGWYNIIDILCGMLSSEVEQARYQLKYAQDNPTSQYIKPIEELEANLERVLEELPVIQQIKEKFGGLRFYTGKISEQKYAYIAFASAMSTRTCEVCGAPGESRNIGWVKTLCDTHAKEKEDKEAEFFHKPKKSEVKLSDE